MRAGRLSKEDIEKMVRDAEKYKDEDDRQKERITAKNSLESYAFNMKSTMEDEKLKGKISAEDKQKVLDKCNEAVRWIDANQVGSDGPRELVGSSFCVVPISNNFDYWSINFNWQCDL